MCQFIRTQLRFWVTRKVHTKVLSAFPPSRVTSKLESAASTSSTSDSFVKSCVSADSDSLLMWYYDANRGFRNAINTQASISPFLFLETIPPVVPNVSWKEVSLLWGKNDLLIWIILRGMVSHGQTWFFSITGRTCSGEEVRIARRMPYVSWARVGIMRTILSWNGLPPLSVLSSKKRNSMKKMTLEGNKFALFSSREKVLEYPYL